jgi:hypothetical protein
MLQQWHCPTKTLAANRSIECMAPTIRKPQKSLHSSKSTWLLLLHHPKQPDKIGNK